MLSAGSQDGLLGMQCQCSKPCSGRTVDSGQCPTRKKRLTMIVKAKQLQVRLAMWQKLMHTLHALQEQ